MKIIAPELQNKIIKDTLKKTGVSLISLNNLKLEYDNRWYRITVADNKATVEEVPCVYVVSVPVVQMDYWAENIFQEVFSTQEKAEARMMELVEERKYREDEFVLKVLEIQ